MALRSAQWEPPHGKTGEDDSRTAFDDEKVLPTRQVVLDVEDSERDEAREGACDGHHAVEDG